MITLTDEELQELKEEIKKEVTEQMKINKLDTIHEDFQQVIENTSQTMTRDQIIEKVANIRDPDERRKLILEHGDLFGISER